MKSLLLLWQKLAHECASRCCTDATRDCKTVTCRYEHEGLSFLTIALPAFGKDFEKSLDLGQVDRNLFTGFGWQAGLPRFLGGFLDLVFDRSSGRLLDAPSIEAIKSIRQLCAVHGKLFLLSSNTRQKQAMRSYIECEQEVKRSDAQLSDQRKLVFRRVSRLLFRDAFLQMDREIYSGDMVPRHGPGATADGLRGNAKYQQRTWPVRLDRYFPSSDYIIPNYSYWEELESVDFLEPGDEIPVKVISVPKTQKTPRIIGVEPTAMQYAQQAVLPVILNGLRRSNHLRAMIGDKDQDPNREMAHYASWSGQLATIDLSEASDRVSYQHVRNLFGDFGNLLNAVDACRSRKADVPGFGVQRLAKFASMGSALCFPVEAMVFLTVIFCGIEKELNRPLTYADIQLLVGRVRVFGDDIIVPVDYVHAVVSELEAFGFKVNAGKSFWTGKFRESCGKEYYDGHDVSVVKLRQKFPTQRSHVTELESLVSFRNHLYEAGYFDTCEWLDKQIMKIIPIFPVVEPSSPALGRYDHSGWKAERWHKGLHKPLIKAYVVASPQPKDPLDGYGALHKFLTKRGELPNPNARHLERAGRPKSKHLQLRWVSPL